MTANIHVTATGLPDAWAAGDTIEISIADPDGPVEAIISIPIDQARAWAGDLYAVITIAHRQATGDPKALTDQELARLPDPGRIITTRLNPPA